MTIINLESFIFHLQNPIKVAAIVFNSQFDLFISVFN